MVREPVAQNLPQPDFHKDRLPELLLMLLFLIGMIVAIGILMVIVFLKKPPPVYLALTPDGQITQDPPLDKPNLAQNVVLNWVNEVMIATFSFNFKNVGRVLDGVRPDYTSVGYTSLRAYFDDKKILEDLNTNRWVYTSFPVSAPQIQSEGVIQGRYTWDILVPIRVKQDNMQYSLANDWNINLSVVRVPTLVAPMGFQIDKFTVLSTQASGITQQQPAGQFMR